MGYTPFQDEPDAAPVRLILEGSVAGFGHIGGALHPVGDGRPVSLGYGLYDIAQAFVLADGDGEADIHFAAGGGDGVGVEAAVSPHRELPSGASVAYPPHRKLRRKVPRACPRESGGWMAP